MDKSYDTFITNLIKEYATRRSDGYYLHASDLPLSELKIFLSHILSAEDYEDALDNPVRTQEYIREFKSDIQYAIDDRIDDVYHEYMNDSGFTTERLSNGDILWRAY